MSQWNPDQYDKFKTQRSEPFFDLMELLEPSANSHIVDLGCGTGELTQKLHLKMDAVDTLGVDSSPQMLDKAAKYAGSGLRFELADIDKWQPIKRPDILFSNAALQWCGDHPQLFKNLTGFLAGRGQLAVQMPLNQDYPTHVIAAKMAMENHWRQELSESRKDESILRPDEYASIMYARGFTIFKVFVRVYGHELKNREDVVEWVKGTLLTHYQKRLSAPRFEEFLSEYKQRLFQELPDQSPFFYPFKRILIWGKF